jgi:hypothetical protein
MTNTVVVQARPEEVRQALEGILTKDEVDKLTFSARVPGKDDFAPDPRGEQAIVETIITFAVHSVAGGILYDILKRAALALINKYGKDKVKEE